ncbi:hypothetical protein BZA05DRAFT_416234 [Tricharina praecox]|uniref:uncharacterized protein n=1 Tax=Tricharina praecox TaxID=43433 RepID=UPI00221FDB71|nr:uncharacterized protein BZA05DRAFT_416234 [Tricharina praecox]KAI5856579.1 hypothetical protein BZA05DRAFT_416234 [Tricharina praecox]
MIATVGLVNGEPVRGHGETDSATTSLAELESYSETASLLPMLTSFEEIDGIENLEVPENGKLTCETTLASPTFFEIGQAIARVSNVARATCQQKNAGGSKCSTLGKYKGGQVGICGRHLLDMSCKWIHWAASKIRFECGNEQLGRAGEKSKFPDGERE